MKVKKNESDDVVNYFYEKKRNKVTKRNIKEKVKFPACPPRSLKEKQSFLAKWDEDPSLKRGLLRSQR